MDSSLKIRNNSIYNTTPNKKSRKKYKKRSAVVLDTVREAIVSNIEVIRNKLNKFSDAKDFIYTNKFCNHTGIYLISDKNRILIIIADRVNDISGKVFAACHANRFELFIHKMKNIHTDSLIDKVNKYIDGFNKWMVNRGNELNNTKIKSEEWFKKKFKKELCYELLDIEYNKPFKKFIYDIFSAKYNLVIEVDGSIHSTDKQILIDDEKDRLTGTYGLTMIRVKAYNDDSYNKAIKEIITEIHRRKMKKFGKPVQEAKYGNVILRKNNNNT